MKENLLCIFVNRGAGIGKIIIESMLYIIIDKLQIIIYIIL